VQNLPHAAGGRNSEKQFIEDRCRREMTRQPGRVAFGGGPPHRQPQTWVDFVAVFKQNAIMKKLALLFSLAVSGVLGGGAAGQEADPVACLKSFSDFQQVDLSRLVNGEIVSERGSLMKLPTGISTQLCFAVPGTAEETARRLAEWNPAPHKELKVYAFRALHTPCDIADFKDLKLSLSPRSVGWLVDKTLTTKGDKLEFNLTRSEAQQITESLKKNSTPAEVSACWARLLWARAAAFQAKGFDGIAPYEVSDEPVSPVAQLRAMLEERSPVAREFEPILRKTGLLGGGVPALTPFYYWQLFSADGYGTLSLGAVYTLPVGDHYQLLDVEYYVNANYHTSVTLYEVWPIRVGDKTGSLVWQGDLYAAPTLAYTKGVDRIAYGAIMLLEIKKSVRAFQGDLKAKH
jgi:hypothetical protein